jgi:hypothetical protein
MSADFPQLIDFIAFCSLLVVAGGMSFALAISAVNKLSKSTFV